MADRRRAERDRERGGASVEHVALVALIALAILAAISAIVAAPPGGAGRELGSAIARKLRCAPRLPGPCRRHPLALAYGFPVGKLVRLLAPAAAAAPGAGGTPLLPVDFRYCRRASCASPGAQLGLTASRRRTTAFTDVDDRRRRSGVVRVTYWLYRPSLGWERIVRTGTRSDIEAASELRLRLGDDPALVPLETLAGRNHYEFPAREEPPWRWRVEGRYPD